MQRVGILLIAVMIFFCRGGVAFGKIVVKTKTTTKTSKCPAKDGSNSLKPAKLKYVSPPDTKAAVFKELKSGDISEFSKWTCKKGKELAGTLTVDYYNSKFEGTHHSGGQIRIRYKKGKGDPSTIRWVQLVNSNDKIGSEDYPIIDPVPEDEPNSTNPDPNKYRPFYYNEEQIGSRTNKSSFDLKFYDFSQRYHPPTSSVTWSGNLYVTSWDSKTPGTISLHDGVKWGWIASCVKKEKKKSAFHRACSVSTRVSEGNTSGVPTSCDRVCMSFNGTGGTIENITCDFSGTYDNGDGNSIEINWDEALEPNTPVTVEFTACYDDISFSDGQWFQGVDYVNDVDPCTLTLTVNEIGNDVFDANIFDSTNSSGVSWLDCGTGYNDGQWYRYPDSGWWNVWFGNGDFDLDEPDMMNCSAIIGRIDPDIPGNVTIVLGYSTDLWSDLSFDRPPLPDDINNPDEEADYIYRKIAEPLYDGPVTEQLSLEDILTSDYNPQYNCVCVQGENVEIVFGYANYDEPYFAPFEGSDFTLDDTVDCRDLSWMALDWLRQGTKFESDINGDESIDFKDFAILANHWKETIPTEEATNPVPPDGEFDVCWPSVDLSWTPGDFAADVNGHDLYFGTSQADVTNASVEEPLGVYLGRIDENIYPISTLDPNSRYFWRVDEVNDGVIWPGDLWNFTTAP